MFSDLKQGMYPISHAVLDNLTAMWSADTIAPQPCTPVKEGTCGTKRTLESHLLVTPESNMEPVPKIPNCLQREACFSFPSRLDFTERRGLSTRAMPYMQGMETVIEDRSPSPTDGGNEMMVEEPFDREGTEPSMSPTNPLFQPSTGVVTSWLDRSPSPFDKQGSTTQSDDEAESRDVRDGALPSRSPPASPGYNREGTQPSISPTDPDYNPEATQPYVSPASLVMYSPPYQSDGSHSDELSLDNLTPTGSDDLPVPSGAWCYPY